MSAMQLLHSSKHADDKRVEAKFSDIREMWFKGVTDS